jgi:hypothetical protein
MKSIAIARVTLDGHHVGGLRHLLEDARLASALRALSVQAKLYAGKSEGRVVDLVRQLIRMRVDAYAFWVCPHSAGATLQLMKGLRNLRADVEFFCWGPSTNDDAHELELASLACRLTALDAEQAVMQLLPRLAETTGMPEAEHFSPYLSGLVAREELFRLGISARQPLAMLEQELAWSQSIPARKESPVPVLADGMEAEELVSVCNTIGSAATAHEFRLRISPSRSGEELVSVAREQGVALELLADEQADIAKSSQYFDNGLAVLNAGIYFDGNAQPATYHLGMSLDLTLEERREAYEWAAPNMSLRSATVVSGPRRIVAELLPSFEAGGGGETRGWPKHVYAVGRDDAGFASEASLDGSTATRQLAHLPMKHYEDLPTIDSDRVFLTLRDAADIEELERRLRRFHEEGRIRVNPPGRAVVFENACRWMGPGACQLPMLRRLEVRADQSVSACLDSGPVGRVGDSFEQLGLNVRQAQQMEEVRRGCSTCPVRESCSHCTQLPSSWGGRYCEIRQNYVQTPLYFELMGFAFFAKRMLPGGIPDTDLAVSYSGLPPRHYQGPGAEERKGSRPVLVSTGDQHLAWWRGTRRLMRLSPPMALMLEAWWKGAEDADIETELARVFQVDAETARDSLKQGLSRLRDGGLINV